MLERVPRNRLLRRVVHVREIRPPCETGTLVTCRATIRCPRRITQLNTAVAGALIRDRAMVVNAADVRRSRSLARTIRTGEPAEE